MENTTENMHMESHDAPVDMPADMPSSTPPTASTNVPHGTSSEKERALAVIAYIGPLFLVSYIFADESKFVKFHAAQGLTFFILAIALRFLLGALFIGSTLSTAVYGMSAMMFGGGSLMMLVHFVLLVLVIIAIVKSMQGEMWEMPVVGAIAKKINV